MMRLMKSAFRFIILAGILGASGSYAQKVGSTSMQFLKVMPCARATALGEAYTVWATGAEAMFWNPAGMASVDNMELSTTYINWLLDAQQGAFSFALEKRNFGAIGIQVQYVDFGEFEETTNQRPYISDPNNPGLTGRTFRPFSYLVGLSYARYLTDKFSLGLSVKYAHESLFNGQRVTAQVRQGVFEEVDTWASGLLFDFGIRYNTGFRSVYIGSAVQNFGADVKYAKESNPVPLLFRFGVGADVIGEKGLIPSGFKNSRLSVASDIFHPNDYAQQIHVGVEYEYGSMFALRGGYKFNYDYDGFTFGAGIRHSMEGLALSADYSYGDMGVYLENVQRISIGLIIP
ncbi:MAG: PorV/PorQ family protein [Calditrichaeota bacterium]|nr:PorV/PorQ family protein [Calditrichota bacterium]MCB9088158.1 PorV/PorQ family protein [Calditrichia bacterium]MCB0290004.1 PorV/PorQ family protein [Calditrichota bacterium]MCB0294689.1 PorV/PorQ family protein [Calditrichota bacterium]MCB0305219.1 PorV/PorQ family protein [Calditrichota bacterium]